MIHGAVLDVLRTAAPETMSPGQVKGKLLEADEGITYFNIVETLKQLRQLGMVEEVSGIGEGATQWRSK